MFPQPWLTALTRLSPFVTDSILERPPPFCPPTNRLTKRNGIRSLHNYPRSRFEINWNHPLFVNYPDFAVSIGRVKFMRISVSNMGPASRICYENLENLYFYLKNESVLYEVIERFN